MPRKKSVPEQPSLLKRDIPKMPEGYYSSGPNPNLAKFVEEHSTPYDPATDDYNVPPFDKPITTTKATAIYNMHTYWSKKPHDAIQQYIRHYTKPGDLVLDPFCGSGGTALAALMEGRKAIAIDLSPAATFITKNYCTPVDVDELQQAFEALKAKVKPEMDWLYETRCDRCGGKATTAYTVYSQVFQCPRCLEKVALFDCPEVKAFAKNGKEKKIRVCPHCHEQGIEEEISTRGKKYGAIPVLVSYICENGCKPKQDERRHNDLNKEKKAYFEQHDLAKIQEIDKIEIPHWYPKKRMMNIESDTEPWGDKWRAGTSNFRTVTELFTKRNLWAISGIKESINLISMNVVDVANAAISATVLPLSLMQRHSDDPRFPNRILMGTYYLPQISREFNVFNWYIGKLKTLLPGLRALTKNIKSTKLLISTTSVLSMSSISKNSMDYIFTDPPYGSNVQYGELNFIWEAWLGFNSNWHNEEIIVNDTRGKTMEDWAEMMKLAMSECYRVLKPGRWISLCYHDTSEGTWQLVQDIMTEVGFIPEKPGATLFIDAGQKSYNQLTADKVTKRDLVINFRKPHPGELGQLTLFSSEDDTLTFSEKARAILSESLERHPGQGADTLYDELVSMMVRKGEFERHNFDELLRQVAEPVSEARMKNLFEPQDADLFGTHESVRWYLKESAATLDEVEARKEDTAAQKLEDFMDSYLKVHNDELGVHYSDLFEQYLLMKDKTRRRLQDWLIEYFYKTEEGTWRPPKDELERAQKSTLRTTGALRTIKRFINALIKGVPPAERDKPANSSTLADWIYQCRRAGLYEMGKTLYEKGGLRIEELADDMKLQVDEDYQICSRRGAEKQTVTQTKRRSRPSQQETLL